MTQPLTMAELSAETLVQKNRRLRQERCKHIEVCTSTVATRETIFVNTVCLDCGKLMSRYPELGNRA